MVNFAIAGAVVLQLGVGLYFHRVTAGELRWAFSATFERLMFSNRHTKPMRVVRGSYR
jgi:hypothetical protein